MQNKSYFMGVLLLLVSLVTWQWAQAADPEPETQHRLVIQVNKNDQDVQDHLLTNIVNLQKHYGIDNIEIEVVAYGPGIWLVTDQSKFKERVESLLMQNVVFTACGNTMDTIEAKESKRPTLLDDVGTTQAGIARLIELQEKNTATSARKARRVSAMSSEAIASCRRCLRNQGGHQLGNTEIGSHADTDMRVFALFFTHQLRYICHHMTPSREEKRHDRDRFRTLSDALLDAVGDGRFRQFKEGAADKAVNIAGLLRHICCKRTDFFVGFGAAATVGNNQQGLHQGRFLIGINFSGTVAGSNFGTHA